MTPLRVIHYNHTSVVAGAEKVLLQCLPLLSQYGIHSIVVSPSGPFQEAIADTAIEGVVCYPLEARFTSNPLLLFRYLRSFVAATRNLRRKFLELQPSILHANSVRAGIVATLATAGTGIPILWHVHDTLPRHPLSLAIRALAAGSPRTSLLAVSHATARTFAGSLWRKELSAKTDVLHNATERRPVRSSLTDRTALRLELGLDDRFTVACIGQICSRKNQVGLVELFAEVVRQLPDARLLLVGSALFFYNEPYEERLRTRVAELGLMEHVLLLGNRSDVPLLLETVDLLALPSRNEPFPMILLEAMAARTPIVAFAVDGVPELLSDGRTAWLVPFADPVQMTRKILWAARNPVQRARLAAAAEESLTYFDTPQTYADHLAALLLRRATSYSPLLSRSASLPQEPSMAVREP